MNPFIVSIIARLRQLRRKCPVCKRDQIVAPDRKNDTVPCKFCGADIPPREKQT